MRSSHSVFLSREAEDDVRQIAEYTAENWGEDHADEYVDEILAAIGALRQYPRRGNAYPAIPDLYWFPVRDYSVFYRVQRQDVEIVRIIHQRRNLTAQLKDLQEPGS